MKIRLRHIILGFIIIFYGCNNTNQQLKTHLKKINSSGIANVDINNWTIKHFYDDDYIFYQLYKKDVDTIFSFEFEYYKQNDQYIIKDYNKFYFNTNDKYYYSLQLEKDTLYYYKIPEPSSLDKEFIVGKYYYLYKFNQLSQGQKGYFIQHKDSLIKVRGNNLAELPFKE